MLIAEIVERTGKMGVAGGGGRIILPPPPPPLSVLYIIINSRLYVVNSMSVS